MNDSNTFQNNDDGYGNASLILGLLMLLFYPAVYFFAIFMLPVALIAIILGFKSLHTKSHKRGIAGIICGTAVWLIVIFFILSSALA